MRKLLLIASISVIATGAFAAFDFANPDSIAKIQTAAQLQTLTGDGTYAMRGIGADGAGNFLILNNNATSTSGLFRVNPTTLTGSSVIGSSALATACTAGAPPFAVSSIKVRPDGAVIFTQFNNTDDLIRVTEGPATAVNLLESDGSNGMTLSPDGTIAYVSMENAFGAVADALITVPTAGGAPTTLCDAATIQAASGATGVSLVGLVTRPNGNIVGWDDQAFGGSDKALEFTPAGAVSVFFDPTTNAALGNSAGGITTGAADTNGNMFFFDEFNATTALQDSLVIRDSAGGFFRIPATTISAAIGSPATFEFKTMAAWSSATEVRLFCADDEADGVVMFVWTDSGGPAGAKSWSAFE